MHHQHHRRRLEEEHCSLVGTVMNTTPGYRAPSGYVPRWRPGVMFKESVYISTKEFPETNFVVHRVLILSSVEKAQSRKEKPETEPEPVVGSKATITRTHESDAHNETEKAKSLLYGVIETIVTTPEHVNDRKSQKS
ncbi:hypothetical protein F4782DRAFT_532243 [Xylaria castorea]|nr:hypothetical protein F4782DRAFT_532243 [Xylaria castorea]